jgi:hypothetical protein
MSRRTRHLLSLSLPVLVALAAAAWLLWPRTAITRENFDRIEVGMTLAEVEAILGGPPREEATGPFVPRDGDPDSVWITHEFMVIIGPGAPAFPADRGWAAHSLLVWVTFDAEGRVSAKNCLPVRRATEPLLDRLRRWLGL